MEEGGVLGDGGPRAGEHLLEEAGVAVCGRAGDLGAETAAGGGLHVEQVRDTVVHGLVGGTAARLAHGRGRGRWQDPFGWRGRLWAGWGASGLRRRSGAALWFAGVLLTALVVAVVDQHCNKKREEEGVLRACTQEGEKKKRKRKKEKGEERNDGRAGDGSAAVPCDRVARGGAVGVGLQRGHVRGVPVLAERVLPQVLLPRARVRASAGQVLARVPPALHRAARQVPPVPRRLGAARGPLCSDIRRETLTLVIVIATPTMKHKPWFPSPHSFCRSQLGGRCTVRNTQHNFTTLSF